MVDPLTLIVSALVAGASAGLKPTAKKAVKDAYEGLKGLVARKFQRVPVDELEEDPLDEASQNFVRARLENAEAEKEQELLEKAREVLKVVRENDPEVAQNLGHIMVSLRGAKQSEVDIDTLIASGNVGIDASNSVTEGTFSLKNIGAGGFDEGKR